MYRYGLCLLAMLLTACASGFDRGGLQQQLNSQKGQFTETEIKKLYQLRPQIRFPVRLAVAPFSGYHTRWTQSDRDMVLRHFDPLQKEGILREVIFLPNLVMKKQSILAARRAAARYQADAVLVVNVAAEVDSYGNPLALFYLTIIGLWLAPGSHKDALCLGEAVLFDVGNEYIYLSAEADGEGSTWGPLALIEEQDAIDRAKKKALTNLCAEIVKRMRRMHGQR